MYMQRKEHLHTFINLVTRTGGAKSAKSASDCVSGVDSSDAAGADTDWRRTLDTVACAGGGLAARLTYRVVNRSDLEGGTTSGSLSESSLDASDSAGR